MSDQRKSTRIQAPGHLWAKIEAKLDEWDEKRAQQDAPSAPLGVPGERPVLALGRFRWRGMAMWGGIAAVVMLAFYLGWWFSTLAVEPALVRLVIEDHVGFVESSASPDFATADAQGLRKWFRSTAGGAVDLPMVDDPDLRLAGGRICELDSKIFYVVLYAGHGTRRAYYITDAGPRGPGLVAEWGAAPRRYASRLGVQYRGWVHDRHLYMMIDYNRHRL